MSKISMAVLLALGIALSPSVRADEFTTSRGLQHLPQPLSLNTEPALAQASASADQVLMQLMRDITEIQRQRRAVATNASGVVARVGADREALERLRAEYAAVHDKYIADLDSLKQRQAALDSDVQRQRAEAAALAARAEVDRPFSEVQRMNAWADEIAARRTALDAERTRLGTAREAAEAQRIKLDEASREAENRLSDGRKEVTTQSSQNDAKLAFATGQLRAAIAYLERVQSYYPLRLKKAAPASPILQQAKQLVARLDAQPTAR